MQTVQHIPEKTSPHRLTSSSNFCMMIRLLTIGFLLFSFSASAQFSRPPDGHVCVAINVLENYVTYYKPAIINDSTCLGVANVKLLDTIVWPKEDSTLLLEKRHLVSESFDSSYNKLQENLKRFVAEVEASDEELLVFGAICQTGYPNTKKRAVVTFSPLIYNRWLLAKVEAYNDDGVNVDYFYLRIEFDSRSNLVGYKILEWIL